MGADMKNHETKRGYVPGDTKEFDLENQSVLLKAQKDIFYLLEQGKHQKKQTNNRKPSRPESIYRRIKFNHNPGGCIIRLAADQVHGRYNT